MPQTWHNETIGSEDPNARLPRFKLGENGGWNTLSSDVPRGAATILIFNNYRKLLIGGASSFVTFDINSPFNRKSIYDTKARSTFMPRRLTV